MDHADLVAEPLHDFQDVRGEEHAEPAAADEIREQRGERSLGHRVHPFERLVQEEQLRTVDERGRQRQLLAHAEGVVRDQLAGIACQLHRLQQLVGAAGGFRAAQAVEAPHEDQVLPAGEPIEEKQAVRNYPDAALEGIAGGQLQDPHRAAGRSEHAGQHGDGGALAGAVLTEKAVEAAARHTQVDAVHGQLIAEAAGERVRLDGEAAHAAAGFFPKATGGAFATLPERGNAACRAKASDSCTSCSGARSITAGCDLSSRCVWAFIEQNFGPHMAQNSAVLNASCGSVSSCFALAASGSRESANCWFQSNAYRARESASSRSRAPARRRATSAAWAAILYAMIPWRTSSALGRLRCSAGVT